MSPIDNPSAEITASRVEEAGCGFDKGSKDSKASLQPLVLNFGGMGDMVMLTPALQLLRERYGQACVLGTSAKWTEDLFRGHPNVTKVYRTGRIRKPYWYSPRQWNFCSRVRRGAFGPVYVGEYTNTDRLRKLLYRAGIAADRCLFWEDYPEDEGMHRSQRWLALASRTPRAYSSNSTPREFTPALLDDYPPYLQVQNDDREDLKRWLSARRLDKQHPLILLQPGSKQIIGKGGFDLINNNRAWPIERWGKLCDQMQIETPDARLLLIGQPAERPLLKAVQRASTSAPGIACDLPIRRMLALQERAWAMVSIDTGPAHTAAALSVPVLVLFALPPEIWRPHSGTSSQVVPLRASAKSKSVADISLLQAVEGWHTLRNSLKDHEVVRMAQR